MAITTLDGAIAGFKPPESYLKVGGTFEAAGVFHSFFYTSGRPGAAVAPSPGLNGTALTTYAGQIPWTNPGAGNKYLARLTGMSTQTGTLLLCDRLWHNSGISITTTTGQSITSPTWPARDRDGSTNGADVMVGLEVSATLGNGAVTNTTLSYVNDTNTGGTKTATIASFAASAQAGSFVPFQLSAGDGGVRSVSSLVLGTTYVSGTMHLVAYRIIANLGMIANVSEEADLVRLGMPRMYTDSVPFLMWLPSATTAATVAGQIIYTEG